MSSELSWKGLQEAYPFPGRYMGNQRPTGSWRSQRPVIDQEKCTRCNLCQIWCPDNTIERTDEASGKHDYSFKVNYEYCKGCGVCANECPVDAITMEREEEIVIEEAAERAVE